MNNKFNKHIDGEKTRTSELDYKENLIGKSNTIGVLRNPTNFHQLILKKNTFKHPRITLSNDEPDQYVDG